MARVTAEPTLDRTMTLGDGRTLAYAEWGDRSGRPVLLFHGMPGSRLLCPDREATESAGVRLITLDRPGYGRSDPHPGRTLLDSTNDIRELADHLGLPAISIIGWSSGGPHALACVRGIPDRVTAVGLAASPGPWTEAPAIWDSLAPAVRALVERRIADPDEALPAIRKRLQWYADDPDSIFRGAGANAEQPDDRLLADPEVLEPMLTWLREGARQGTAGYVEDWIAELGPWGFRLDEVTRPTFIWWGEEDDLTPRVHTDALASGLPGAHVVVYPGEGHLAPVTHWAEMLAAVLDPSVGTSAP